MNEEKEIYMINEVTLPSFEQGISEQSTNSICTKCNRTKADCKCRR